jgi:hypothetical protein
MTDKNRPLAIGYFEDTDCKHDDVREEDERHAWDTYLAFSQYSDPKLQAEHADKLLEERRKRWGGV